MPRKFNQDGIMNLTPKDVARLNRVTAQTTEMYERSKVTYPKRSELVALTNRPLAEIDRRVRALGFSRHSLLTRPEDVDLDSLIKGIKRKNRNRRGHGKTLPNPDLVYEIVRQLLDRSKVKPVSASGPVVWGELNFEFLTPDKARYFELSYKALTECAHIWLCGEVSREGLEDLAEMIGYTAVVSRQKYNQGQCVGILVHPGLTLLGEAVQDDDVATVHGMTGLRPSLRQDLRDWNGNEFFACPIHLKSMIGGVDSTAAIRYAQCQVLATKLKGRVGIVGGDWNCKLRSTNDTKPLLDIGGVLAGSDDDRRTQAMGGDLDGFIQLRMEHELGPIEMLDWLTVMGRKLTDHNALIASQDEH